LLFFPSLRFLSSPGFLCRSSVLDWSGTVESRPLVANSFGTPASSIRKSPTRCSFRHSPKGTPTAAMSWSTHVWLHSGRSMEPPKERRQVPSFLASCVSRSPQNPLHDRSEDLPASDTAASSARELPRKRGTPWIAEEVVPATPPKKGVRHRAGRSFRASIGSKSFD
jgi:hypothetical protein